MMRLVKDGLRTGVYTNMSTPWLDTVEDPPQNVQMRGGAVRRKAQEDSEAIHL